MKQLFYSKDSGHPDDIYHYRPGKPWVKTAELFFIQPEGKHLRVENKNVNCLFNNLTRELFDVHYNHFIQFLNIDFSPIAVQERNYELLVSEQEFLIQKIITSWIYYYTINNLEVKVQRDDFTHPYMTDYILSLLDKKYGIDTLASLALGAHLLRMNLYDYCNTVKGRRTYYNR